MEKHFLVMSSGLTEAQKDVTKDLQGWVGDFAQVCRPAYERKRLKFALINIFSKVTSTLALVLNNQILPVMTQYYKTTIPFAFDGTYSNCGNPQD